MEEFVSRSGTDYGPVEWSLPQKTAQVLAQLRRGEACIVFDENSETVNIVRCEDFVGIA